MLFQTRLNAAILAALFATFAVTGARADQNDPPGRAARLSYTHGATSFSPAGESEWVDTMVNRPLVSGDRLWADRDGRAEIDVGSAALRLSANTNFELVNFDDRTTQVELTQGTLYVRLRQYAQDQNFEIDTPTMAITLTQVGQYRIDVDPDGQHTTVAVTQGSAAAFGDNAQYPLRAGDRVRFHSVDLRDAEQLSVVPPDDFDRFSTSRDERAERSASLRYVTDGVVGADDLDEYGSWSSQSDYGHVWYPSHVDANWAPYSDGQWIWQDPWGWTWVDNAPWGFAPAHYGRWVSIDNRWGWVPGPRGDRAIYAPALVAFIGGGGFSIGISTGGAGPIGWFALGARDVYEPPYHASRDYFTRVNVTNTTINNVNITNVYNNYSSDKPLTQASYANRTVAGAVTAVPGNVFINAQPVRASAVKVDSKMLASTQVTRLAAVAPSARSVIGSAPAARVKPSNAVLERKVVAQTPPPPTPVPFAARQQELQRSPGRPMAPSAVTALQPTASAAATHPNVRVLGPQADAVNVRNAGPAHAQSATGANGPSQDGPGSAPRVAGAPAQRETVQGPQQKGHKGPPQVEQKDSQSAETQSNAQSAGVQHHVPSPPPQRDTSPSSERKPDVAKREVAASPESPQIESPPPAPQHRLAPRPQQDAPPSQARKGDAAPPSDQQKDVAPAMQQRHAASPPQPQQDAPPSREHKRDVAAPTEAQQSAAAPTGQSQRVAAPSQPQAQPAVPTSRERKSDVAASAESQQNAVPPSGPQHRVAKQPAAPQRQDVPTPAQDQHGAPPAHEQKRSAPPQQQGESIPVPENAKGAKAAKKKDQGNDADATDGGDKKGGGNTPSN